MIEFCGKYFGRIEIVRRDKVEEIKGKSNFVSTQFYRGDEVPFENEIGRVEHRIGEWVRYLIELEDKGLKS